MNRSALHFFGLKFNPFEPGVPVDALFVPSPVDAFCRRIEASLLDGGFATVTGEPGSGKSVVMRLLADRLARLTDLAVGVIRHPQSNLSDFYRELGDIFGVALRMSNRWGASRRCAPAGSTTSAPPPAGR